MPFFLRCDSATGRCLGAYETSRAPDPPPAGTVHRFLDDAERAAYNSARRQQAEEGRDDPPTLAGAIPGKTSVSWQEHVADASSPTGRKLQTFTRECDCLVGGTVAEPADTRPRFSVALPSPELVTGTPVTVTFTARNADGSVRTQFAGVRPWTMPDGQRHRLTFAGGVATLAWSPRASGQGIFRSGNGVRLQADVRFEVWDS